MYKIGVIGERESVLGFKAVGLDVFPCQDKDSARDVLHRIAKDEYAIVYITESLCKDMQQDIERYKDVRMPAIIPIPGVGGTCGIGMSNLKKAVERAVGADILFSNE